MYFVRLEFVTLCRLYQLLMKKIFYLFIYCKECSHTQYQIDHRKPIKITDSMLAEGADSNISVSAVKSEKYKFGK